MIAEIETDKATMEVEAVDEGVLAKIVVPDGTADVPVNELIAVIAGEGEDPKVGSASAPRSAKRRAAPTGARRRTLPQPPQPPPRPAATLAASCACRRACARREARRARRARASFASPLARRHRQGRRHRHLRHRRLRPARPRRRARRARRHGRRHARRRRPPPQRRCCSRRRPGRVAPPACRTSTIKKLYEPGSFEEVPHDIMRKVIARRLLEAKQTIPHFYLTVDCELDALLALREQINAAAPKDKDGKPAFKVSVNDFVIKALALALTRVPEANVTWTESAMLKHKHADVGVAVSIPGGLITPVVRKADTKTCPRSPTR